MSLIALLGVLFLGTPALLVGLALLYTATTDDCMTNTGDGSSVQIDLSKVPKDAVAGYNHDQMVNAAYILKAGFDQGLGLRDQTIGVMTAMGESSLMLIDHGDAAGPDSRGLFQQRDGWGPYADRMDPYKSAVLFFKALMKVGNRENNQPTLVAHSVQVNADPMHYRQYWNPAVQVVSALSKAGGSTSDAGSHLQPASAGESHVNVGPVKPVTQSLADIVAKKFAVRTVYGYRASDPIEDSDHPKGLALDFMVGSDVTRGQEIANFLQANASDLSVQYVIWYQHIWNIDRAKEGFRPMKSRGNATANHMDHVHVSLRANGSIANAALAQTSGDCSSGATNTQPVNATGWAAPAAGGITSPFGMRMHPTLHVYKLHDGTDFGGGCGAPIYAANDGVVVSVTQPKAYGQLITIDHGSGIITRYGHMYDNGVMVHAGQRVKGGEQIAKIGSNGFSTGCHLHFQVRLNGKFVNPATYLNSVNVKLA